MVKKEILNMSEDKINYLKKIIDEKIEEYFTKKINLATHNKLLYESMYYSIKDGGKRARAILFILTYGIFKENYEDYFDFALAIEMIHCYSLIHDDLPCMDDDDLRRGKPTNHKVYGEAIALLAGDGLLNEAFEVLIKLSIDDRASLKASYEISKAIGGFGMIGGQIADILGENKKLNEEELRYIHENKTGKLIKASIISAGILCNCDQDILSTLGEFGEKLGYAFQIKDDILDVIGDEDHLGKSINCDIKNEKSTFVSFYGLERSIEIYDRLSLECMDILDRLSKLKDVNLLKSFTLKLIKRNN